MGKSLEQVIGKRYICGPDRMPFTAMRPCYFFSVPRTGTRSFLELCIKYHPAIEIVSRLRAFVEARVDPNVETPIGQVRSHIPWQAMLGPDPPMQPNEFDDPNERYEASANIMRTKPFVATLRCPLRTAITHRFTKRYDPARPVMGFLAIAREWHRRDDIVTVPIDNEKRVGRIEQALLLWDLPVLPSFLEVAANSANRKVGTLMKHARRMSVHVRKYNEGDMDWLRSQYPTVIEALTRFEDELRPMFEDAGYTDFPWYT